MDPRFINPNLHVILIHYPLGLLSIGLLIEIFGFLWGRSSVRSAGRWMILLGTLALVPAATSGIYALRDVAANGAHGNDQSWHDLRQASSLSPRAWEMASNHILLNSIAAAIALITVVTWIGCSDRWRRRIHVPAVLLMVVAMGFISAGAWHGGEMVFTQGVGVDAQRPNPPDKQLSGEERVDKYLSPMQLHIIGAGLVFAIAAAALGMSIRATVESDTILTEEKPLDEAAAELNESANLPDTQPRPISIHASLDDPQTATVVTAIPPRVPSTRFWVLAAVVAIGVILGGFWVGDFFKPGAFKPALEHTFKGMRADHRRKAMHIIFGGSILVLALILAGVTRWAPRSRVVLGVFSGLLVLVMAAQVWMGIALLYDSPSGPLTGFQPLPAAAVAPTSDGHH